MVKIGSRSLQRQLFVAILLLIVPILLAAAWLGTEEFRETVEELTQQTEVTASRTAALVQRELSGFERMVGNLSVIPVVRELDGAAVQPLLSNQTRQNPALLDLALLDPGGRLVARSPSTLEKLGGWSDIASQVMQKRARVVSPLRHDRAGLAFVTIAHPINDEAGTITGVMAYHVNPQLLQDAVNQAMLPEGSVVVLSDMRGEVLARSPGDFDGRLVAASGLADGAGPPRQHDGADGVRRVIAHAPVEGGAWVITVGIPIAVAFDRTMTLWLRTVPALAVVLVGWVIVAVVYSRRLTGSLVHLETAAQRIASGDFSPIERRTMPTREFAELQSGFEAMLRRFNEARAALDAQMAEERRMRQEVESLQRQVIRQERLAAVGQLVSGVAHEINNPLQAILGFAELLQMQGELPESVKSDLLLIQKESARACGIIRNLAMFARQQTGEAEPVHLGDVIRSVAELRQRRLESENIELRIEDDSTRHVSAVLAELQQVVLNFVVNAEQAIVLSGRQPGCITIRTQDRGDRILLEVEDTGPGVAPEHEARLFQPFFTTKAVGQGTGLGLSVSYGIIDSLGGRIGYRNGAAGGAIFYFELPAAA
ncbi:MAG: hypothetical protein A3F70_13090 [Acidobacteria bacterium RIFCSPLOWO2_12_FULL_67_14]|nr:MAG: hypothetical protein A3H29_10340 [Acidobacteria bacterium RIFCSPLOWO2_02_FULL_67_21]OFW36857.1 MAG: hypothetical protein A3F70_13090 [Acidobacteria bacterium RIFCSPLOWO2_12_FULL_67_14]